VFVRAIRSPCHPKWKMSTRAGRRMMKGSNDRRLWRRCTSGSI
jgi:hypothetical protein